MTLFCVCIQKNPLSSFKGFFRNCMLVNQSSKCFPWVSLYPLPSLHHINLYVLKAKVSQVTVRPLPINLSHTLYTREGPGIPTIHTKVMEAQRCLRGHKSHRKEMVTGGQKALMGAFSPWYEHQSCSSPKTFTVSNPSLYSTTCLIKEAGENDFSMDITKLSAGGWGN